MEPKRDSDLSLEAKAALLHSLVTKNHGTSSKTIIRALLREEPSPEDYHPSDTGDFKRCLNAVHAHPDIYKVFMAVMPSRSIYWEHLCRVWSAVEYLLDNDENQKAYDLMCIAKQKARQEQKHAEIEQK